MSTVIGVTLLLVFFVFAILMFLERISALLALPLMALAFLLVAVGADLAQPAQVSEVVSRQTVDLLGRREITVDRQNAASRFEQWKLLRIKEHELLKAKADLFVQAVGAISEEATRRDGDLRGRMERAIADALAGETQLRQRLDAELAALPDFHAHPPHTRGRRAEIERAFDEIAMNAQLVTVSALLEDLPEANAASSRIADSLETARSEAKRWQARYATPPDPTSFRFRAVSAASYVFDYILFVLRAGSLHLYAAVIATVFGGMFAMYVKNLRVAERLVYWTAEFAGERTYVIALAIFIVTAVIFTSVGGLGTVIMLGAIILPILRSVGLGPIVGAGVFLIAIAMGGTLHPVSRRLWIDFYGIPASQLDSILWTMVGLYAACGLAWIWWGARRGLRSSFHAEPDASAKPPRIDVPARLMAAPLIPVALVYFGGVEEISAFTISIAYMYVCICRRPGATRDLAKSLIEGAQAVIPPALLMVGIGILVTSLSTPPVQSYLRPLLAATVPESRFGYIALFALGAPLALYRGPLNVWGMGLAVSATLLATSALPPAAVLCAILAAGMLQGVCDPTNTANVWIAGFQGVTVNQILRYTIVPVWAAAIVGVVIFGLRFVGG